MTKQQLIDRVKNCQGIPKQTAKRAVDLVFESMTKELAKGGRVEIRGFGSFQVRIYGRFKSRNPRTGKSIEVEAKKLPHFRVGKELRKRIKSS